MDIHGVGVPADVVVGFEDHDLMVAGQQVRGGLPGNPRTDNGNSHRNGSLLGHT
jgi:hypothetical protein